MLLLLFVSYINAAGYCYPAELQPSEVVQPSPDPEPVVPQEELPEEVPVAPSSDDEDPARYPSGGSCAEGGTFSTNEFGAQVCEYPATSCPITKYFTYPDGGGGVELCCSGINDCNYDPVKNYCHPDLLRCVDGSYFGCSTKGGPVFDECLW
jgi:hypothetical protein